MNDDEIKNWLLDERYITPEHEPNQSIVENTIQWTVAVIKAYLKKDELKRHSENLELLERYSKFLQDQGYTDTDWIAEHPTAIDQFFKK